MKIAIVMLVAALAGCGGGSAKKWGDDDALRFSNSVKSWVQVEQLCSVADSSQCTPATMRALGKGSICPEASGLAHHGEAVPDLGGTSCQKK
jgi:hypothetical protein